MLVSLIAVLAVAAMASTSYTPNQKPLGHPTPEYPIPGGEPWRNCVDPTDHLFKIDSAGMDPNPCMVESLCKINITGNLTKYITNATISFNVAPHFNDGRVGEIPGIDDFYQWVNVYQNNTRTRHLQPGPALMNQSFLLWGGWVPVANYSAVFNVTTPEGTLFRLCGEWEMKLRGT
ncbi:MAG: hypothetical protein L6R38_007019 [Xanthoria sp. 2 TBL-2021]|nr:MAG: hypothetical protein L6R38_007019 [Xanthoria sp. 2 TBL-2021]